MNAVTDHYNSVKAALAQLPNLDCIYVVSVDNRKNRLAGVRVDVVSETTREIAASLIASESFAVASEQQVSAFLEDEANRKRAYGATSDLEILARRIDVLPKG